MSRRVRCWCWPATPAYDPNTLSEGYSELSVDPDRPLRNRALLDTYTPGSIFKPVVALAGLASGEIDSDSLVNCNHVYNYYASVYGAQAFTPTCLGYHGDITVKEALKYSCNIFFYDVGRRVGIDAIVDAAQMLGLGVNNGFELWTNPGTISSPATAEATGENGITAMCFSPPSDSGSTSIHRCSWLPTV